MATTDPATSGAPARAPLGAGTRLGAVHLTVSDLDRSVAFYERSIGLRVQRREDGRASLGTGAEDLLVLVEDRDARPAGRHAGLYHFALLHPSRDELARAAARLAATRTPIEGASDHGISEAIYLPDPDGNGIELAADRPREQWPDLSNPGWDQGPQPLDLHALLGLVAGERPELHASPELVVGHVHLHVSELDDALAFWGGVVGFDVMTRLPSALFVAAGGYHHHLGLNVWRGRGIPAMPATGVVGLRQLTLVLEPEDAEAVRARAVAAGLEPAAAGPGFELSDPSGNHVAVLPSPGEHLRSRAVAQTDDASRYLLQLAKHFAHKLDVTYDPADATIPFAAGTAVLHAADGRLTVEAESATPAGRVRVEHVIARHLARFAFREDLTLKFAPEE